MKDRRQTALATMIISDLKKQVIYVGLPEIKYNNKSSARYVDREYSKFGLKGHTVFNTDKILTIWEVGLLIAISLLIGVLLIIAGNI